MRMPLKTSGINEKIARKRELGLLGCHSVNSLSSEAIERQRDFLVEDHKQLLITIVGC